MLRQDLRPRVGACRKGHHIDIPIAFAGISEDVGSAPRLLVPHDWLTAILEGTTRSHYNSTRMWIVCPIASGSTVNSIPSDSIRRTNSAGEKGE